jgi:hypothetical protein
VVVGSIDNDDAIYEVNAKSGVSLWRFQTLVGFDADIGAPATIVEPGTAGASGSQTFTDGVVYDTGKDAHTYGIDLQTGAQIWVSRSSRPLVTATRHSRVRRSLGISSITTSDTAPAGAFFYSVPPTRVCDTRTGPGTECDGQGLTPLDTLQVGMAGVLVVPAEGGSTQPAAVVANLTGIAGTAATFFTLYPSDAATKPKASDLNPSAGEVLANLAIVGLATTGPNIGKVALFNAAGDIDGVLDVAGWFQ